MNVRVWVTEARQLTTKISHPSGSSRRSAFCQSQPFREGKARCRRLRVRRSVISYPTIGAVKGHNVD